MDKKLDGQLRYIKKNKYSYCRCLLTVDNELIIFEPNKTKVKARFFLKNCEKFSKYNDMSWEICLKPNKVYRLINDDPRENLKWFKTISSIFNKDENNTENSTQINQSETINSTTIIGQETSIFDLILDTELTNRNFLSKLSPKTIYYMTIDESGISLQDKNTSEMHAFEASVIRKFGATDDCFAFELGRNLEYGNGLIALKSRKYDSKEVYNHFKELTERSFLKLSSKIKNSEILRQTQSVENLNDETNFTKESINLINGKLNNTISSNVEMSSPIPTPRSNQISKNQYSTSSKYILNNQKAAVLNSKSLNDLSDSKFYQINNNNSSPQANLAETSQNDKYIFNQHNQYEIKIHFEDTENIYSLPKSKMISSQQQNLTREVNRQDSNFSFNNLNNENENENDSTLETDESFYQDKYVPEYINNRYLRSPALEYFIDEENSVYGRVKL